MTSTFKNTVNFILNQTIIDSSTNMNAGLLSLLFVFILVYTNWSTLWLWKVFLLAYPYCILLEVYHLLMLKCCTCTTKSTNYPNQPTTKSTNYPNQPTTESTNYLNQHTNKIKPTIQINQPSKSTNYPNQPNNHINQLSKSSSHQNQPTIQINQWYTPTNQINHITQPNQSMSNIILSNLSSDI